LLYMVQSRKGQALFLSTGFRTGTAWSAMTRRMKIETQVLDERTGTSGLSTSCMLTKSYAVLQAPNDDLAGNRLGNPADWRRCGEHRGNPCAYTAEATRADEGNRTPNLLITNQLLCQLSYVSQCAEKDKLFVGRASAPLTFKAMSASMLHPLINRLVSVRLAATPA
jgi:hypothetical protein